jgi:CspA family cold shock protein
MTNRSENVVFLTGTIKCFFPFKGYGFISREKGKDVFFFYKELKDEGHIYEGAKVQFLIENNKPGNRAYATQIQRIG